MSDSYKTISSMLESLKTQYNDQVCLISKGRNIKARRTLLAMLDALRVKELGLLRGVR